MNSLSKSEVAEGGLVRVGVVDLLFFLVGELGLMFGIVMFFFPILSNTHSDPLELHSRDVSVRFGYKKKLVLYKIKLE